MLNINSKLENFFSNLKEKASFVNEINSLFGKTLALDFNSLDFWTINENKVSEIIAFFLDPRQKHHQGDLYLKLFIDYFKLDFTYAEVNEIEVLTEKVIDENRRLDIFITYKTNKKVIGIENKIHHTTKDQENQVIDYINYLQRINRDSFHLFYLAPKRKLLSDKSISESDRKLHIDNKQLYLINYEEDIIGLIHSFAIHTENERVRSFLLDLERKLQKNYIGMESINDVAIISEYVGQSEDNIELAFKVANSLQKLKENLKISLVKQMKEVAEELNLEFVEGGSHFIVPNLNKHFVKINYEMGGFIYGIVKTPEQYNNSNKYNMERIEKLYPNKFKSSQWWPLWDFLYPQIDLNSSLWMDIKNGQLKKKVKEFIEPLLTLKDLD